MGFSLASLTRELLVAAGAGMVVFSAGAQPIEGREGQPILFSSPASDELVSNTPSLSPRPPELLDSSDSAQTPSSLDFNRPPPAAPLTPMGPMLTPAQVAQERDRLDRNRNWALLTPAEILGLVTPEKILGISERDAFGRPKNLTVLERYTERQNRLLLSGKTNAPPTDNAFLSRFFPNDRLGEANSAYGAWGNPESLGNPWFNSAPNTPQNENRGWAKLFDTTPAAPVLAPAPNPAQVEDMERFRQLLNPGSPSTAAGATPALGGLKTTLPQALLNAGLTQSPPARMGVLFPALSSGIGKPAELPKLTGAGSLNYTSPPPVAPWLSPPFQPFAAPQRKF